MRVVIDNRPVVRDGASYVPYTTLDAPHLQVNSAKSARDWRVRDEMLDRDGRSLPLQQVSVKWRPRHCDQVMQTGRISDQLDPGLNPNG